MKISDLLHKVADTIPPDADKEVDLDKQSDDVDQITDAMVPPLQQELELKKKRFGVSNAFDKGQVAESTDELALIKKLTGLK